MPNKADFIERLSVRLGSDKKSAATALDAVLDEIYAIVSKGDKLALTGFGSFEKRDRAARIARNPATGASVRVKKTSVPAFRAGAEFKAIVSDPALKAEIDGRGHIAVVTPPPDALARYVEAEIARWAKVVEQAGAIGTE